MPEGRREQSGSPLVEREGICVPPSSTVTCDGKLLVVVIVGEGAKAHADLLQVVRAGGTLSLQLSLPSAGKQQRSEDGNDGDDNQQLDQSEPASPSVWLVPVHAMEF